MALERKYDDLFERHIWKPYPKWPIGRSKKELAYKAYLAAKKLLGLNKHDCEQIEKNIEQRKRDCETWQPGNRFGPVGCQVYIRQMLWNEPYARARDTSKPRATGMELSEEQNQRIFWRDEARRGRPVPPQYAHYLETH